MTKSMGKRQNGVKKNKRKRAGRRAVSTVGSLLALALLAFGAFEAPNLLNLWPAQTHGVMARGTDLGEDGTVLLKTEGTRCERIKYDEVGHVVEPPRPCANADLSLDEQGRPLPTGTMHRLDAISGSFLGRQ